MCGRFGQQAFRGEAGQGVDFKKIWLIGLFIDHHINSRQITRPDDFVRLARKLLNFCNQWGGQAGVKMMFGCRGFVLGFEVKKLRLDDDPDRCERLLLEQTHSQLGAFYEFLNQRLAVFFENRIKRFLRIGHGLADEDID
jgi:hypothetical protein